MSPPPRAVRVVAALIGGPNPGEFLVQQRPEGKDRALLWEFPGGKVEPGESDEQALLREGQEELGVTLGVGEQVWRTTHAYPDLTVELLLYRARIQQGAPQPHTARALRFLTPAQMRALPFCEADLPLLEALCRGELGG